MINMYICKHTKYKMIKSSQLMYLSFHLYFHIEILEFFLTAILTYVLFLILAILLYNRYSNVFLTPNWSCFFLLLFHHFSNFPVQIIPRSTMCLQKTERVFNSLWKDFTNVCLLLNISPLHICQHRKFSYFTEETYKTT